MAGEERSVSPFEAATASLLIWTYLRGEKEGQLFLFRTHATETSWTWQMRNFSAEWERSIELDTPPTHVPKYLVP